MEENFLLQKKCKNKARKAFKIWPKKKLLFFRLYNESNTHRRSKVTPCCLTIQVLGMTIFPVGLVNPCCSLH